MDLGKKARLFSLRLLNFRHWDLALAFAVALIALLAFSRFFGIQLMESDALSKILFHRGTDAAEIFRIFSQPDGFPISSFCYRPFSSLFFWIIFLFNGISFGAFHAFNFALHALNSVLVFFLARKLIKDKRGFFSFLASAIFALHPINLTTVLFVSRMPEMMAAFFMLASLLALNAFLERKNKRFYFLSVFFCFAGIFSKEVGTLVPFVLFFYCIIFLHEKSLRQLLRKSLRLCLPFFSLIALYVALMFFSLGRFAGFVHSSSWLKSQVAVSFIEYLFYPVNFLSANPFNDLRRLSQIPLGDPLILIAFIASAALILRFFSKKERDRPVLFLFSWFFIFLTAFTLGSVIHPWYTYVPLIPFALLLSVFLQRNSLKFKKSIAAKAVSLFIALLFLSFLAFSSLAVNYRYPLIAGEITQSVLSQTVRCASELPQDSALLLLNYPKQISAPEKGLNFIMILVEEHSVQLVLDSSLPEKKLRVISLSESILFTPPFDENQFSFSPEGNCVFLMQNLNKNTAIIKLPSQQNQEKLKKAGITVEREQQEESETIKIILPEQLCESAFFFFFDGKKVQVIKASEANEIAGQNGK